MVKIPRIGNKLHFSLFFLVVFPLLAGILKSSPALAQCVTVLGRRVCAEDVDPTRHIPGSATVAEEAWGEAGRIGYTTAAQWMRANNGSSQALNETQKRYLRPKFGSLVDRVTVIYNANLMDEWSAGGYRIDVGDSHQTYCDRIYIDDPYQPGSQSQIVTIAHELVHSRQCEQLGGASNFGYHYFKEFKKAGQNYRNNKLEVEAYNEEEQFRSWLASNWNPSPSPMYDQLNARLAGCYYMKSLNNNFRNSNFRWLDAKSDGVGVGLVNGQSHGTIWYLEESSQGNLLRSANQNHRSVGSYRWLDGMSNGTGVQLVSDTSHGTFWKLEQVQGGYRIRSLNNNFRNSNFRWLDGASNGSVTQLVNGTSHGTLWELASTSCP